MVAGLNIKVNFWRYTMGTDDDVGGAQATGTVVYRAIPARMTARRPSTLLLQQGLETEKIFDLIVQGSEMAVNERDEVEIVWPTDHTYCSDRFRILGVELSGRRQAYGPMQFTLSRIVRSRSQQ